MRSKDKRQYNEINNAFNKTYKLDTKNREKTNPEFWLIETSFIY